jgi:hypothetical protein
MSMKIYDLSTGQLVASLDDTTTPSLAQIAPPERLPAPRLQLQPVNPAPEHQYPPHPGHLERFLEEME